MEVVKKIDIQRAFDRLPTLKKAIHSGKDLETHLETLAGVTGISLNFLLINKNKVQQMAFHFD